MGLGSVQLLFPLRRAVSLPHDLFHKSNTLGSCSSGRAKSGADLAEASRRAASAAWQVIGNERLCQYCVTDVSTQVCQ